MTVAVGVDVGGTKTAVGLVDIAAGRVLRHIEFPTAGHQLGLLEKLTAAVSEVSAQHAVTTIGVGVCELVDLDGAMSSAQSVSWTAEDVRAALLHAGRVTIESDVRAAARAEARYTDAGHASSFLFVVLGTGISSTFVIAGRPHVGHHGHAIALCGVHLESAASGAALRRNLRAIGSPIETGSDLAAALRAHPDYALAAADRVGADLAVAVNVLDPELVVIGGGLGLNDHYRQLIEDRVRADIYSPSTRSLTIRASLLGSDVGVIGAALAGAEQA